MASRGFYLVSTALLGGTALLLWLVIDRDPPPPTPGSEPAPAGAPGGHDGRVLGVAAADHDSAQRSVGDRGEVAFARQNGTPQAVATPPRRTAQPAVAASPIAGSPEMNAASEASAAVQPKVVAAVRADLDKRRDALRKECWPPGSNLAATFTVDATYAADGKLLSFGVSDVPGMPGVGSCLSRQLAQKPPILPEPPGVDVAVKVPVAFAGSQQPPPRPTPTLGQANG